MNILMKLFATYAGASMTAALVLMFLATLEVIDVLAHERLFYSLLLWPPLVALIVGVPFLLLGMWAA